MQTTLPFPAGQKAEKCHRSYLPWTFLIKVNSGTAFLNFRLIYKLGSNVS